MMRRNLGVGMCGLLGLVLSVGCSSKSGSDTTATGGRWPSAPSGGTPATTTEKNFAVNALFLGDSNRSGTVGRDSWKGFGFNLDGKISTRDSTDVCKLVSGADRTVHDNGNDGIDNAFGHNIVSFIASIEANPSQRLTQAVTDGKFTIMFNIKGLSDDAAQNSTNLTGSLFTGARYDDTLAKKPTFSPTDNWPVRDSLTPVTTFDGSYVAGGTWVSGAPKNVTVSLVFTDRLLTVNIKNAIVTFKHSAANDATEGTVAGIVSAQELLTEVLKVAGAISTSFCPGKPSADELTKTITQSADILLDGTQDPARSCDGISIGIGFTAKAIAPPSVIGTNPPPSDPCAN